MAGLGATAPVRLIGCNGDDVSMAAIVKALDARFRRLAGYNPIVIVLDRERREETCEHLIRELSAMLDAKNYGGQYVIGMPDRTIENWILADWSHIVEKDSEYKSLMVEPCGQHGKSLIRKLLPASTIYHETTVGLELFLKCRPAQMFAADGSFRHFVDQLKFECWWLENVDARFCPMSWLKPASSS